MNARGSGIKNWLILGAAGAGAYFVYKYFNSAESAELKKNLKNSAAGVRITPPDLDGPMVTKFEIASTRTTNCISEPDKSFVYAPITSTNPVTGYNTFSSPTNGHFTRRMLCKGGKRWAEIKPTSGPLGSLGEFIDVGFGRRVAYYAP